MTEYSSELTRKKLLLEALEVFAQQGYHRASVREICRKAEANSAAVHYHFGDKAALYKAVFKDAMKELKLDERPLNVDKPLLEALRDYYGVLLSGACSQGASRHLAAIRAREEFEPTGLLVDVWSQHIQPFHEHVRTFISAYTGLPGDHPELETLCFSLAGLAMPYVHMPAVVEALSPGMLEPGKDQQSLIQRLARLAEALLNASKDELGGSQ